MIISKNSLQSINLTEVDKNIPVLDCIRIEQDGTVVAGNGKSFITISPVNDKIKQKLSSILDNKDSNAVTITSLTAKEVIKNIDSKKFNSMLAYTDIESNGSSVNFIIYDGARKHIIEGKSNPNKYPPFADLYKRALRSKSEIKLVINLKRLIPLLETMQKVSDDSSDFSPVFIEFTQDKDIILRMVNPKTGQRCIGLMWSYKGNEAKWLEADEWERRLKNGFFSDNNDVEIIKSNDSNSDRTNGDNNSNCNNINNTGKKNHEQKGLKNGYSTDNTNSANNIDKTIDTDRADIISDNGNSCIDSSIRSNILKNRKGAKKIGDRSLAQIIDEMCPKCGKFHLASDGNAKWCSCKSGCNYYKKG